MRKTGIIALVPISIIILIVISIASYNALISMQTKECD